MNFFFAQVLYLYRVSQHSAYYPSFSLGEKRETQKPEYMEQRQKGNQIGGNENVSVHKALKINKFFFYVKNIKLVIVTASKSFFKSVTTNEEHEFLHNTLDCTVVANFHLFYDLCRMDRIAKIQADKYEKTILRYTHDQGPGAPFWRQKKISFTNQKCLVTPSLGQFFFKKYQNLRQKFRRNVPIIISSRLLQNF